MCVSKDTRDQLRSEHLRLVRDLRQWPEDRLRYQWPDSNRAKMVLAERARWLQTRDGKRMLKLLSEVESLINKED